MEEDGDFNTVIKLSERHDNIWKSELKGKRRIISQGDLRYDINQNVTIVLPVYFDKRENKVKEMMAISGIIVDIFYNEVNDSNFNLIPRETKLHNSSENLSIYGDSSEWAKPLIISSPRENTDDAIQTYIISYKIELSEDYIITENDLKMIYYEFSNLKAIPFKYNLDYCYDTKTIIVDYRYIMGATYDCCRLYSDINRKDVKLVNLMDIQSYIDELSLKLGILVKYSNQNSELIFYVKDFICNKPLDIKFIIKCKNKTDRILAVSDLYPFDIRCKYSVKDLNVFHALPKYTYEIIKSLSSRNPLIKEIKEVIHNRFDPLKIFVVLKSLCSNQDLDTFIYENKEGNMEYYSSPDYNIAGYKYTGIATGDYIRGLVYPEGKMPTDKTGYVFFSSKEYHEIDFDKGSDTFFEFCSSAHKHSKFRDPSSKDKLLGSSFICQKDNFKGKTNLRWFYPTNEFRILHLYIINRGKHQYFSDMNYKDILNSLKDNPIMEELFNLYIFGNSEKNPTLNNEFTIYFLKKFIFSKPQ